VPVTIHHLVSSMPSARESEVIETLLDGRGVRVERIVSFGHASPDGFWYDQDEAEWVVVLAGRARLLVEDDGEERALGPGDAILLLPHRRHRVSWTDPDQPTVWLAVFIDEHLLNGS
jgi:cupin 2 domain-containing protein